MNAVFTMPANSKNDGVRGPSLPPLDANDLANSAVAGSDSRALTDGDIGTKFEHSV